MRLNVFDYGSQTYATIGVLILLGLLFNTLTSGVFLSPRNLSLLFRQTAIVGTVAASTVLLIVVGEIDLSIGSAVGLISILVATLQVNGHWGTPETILVVLIAGPLLGLWQGYWVAMQRIPAFVVTLAGLLIFRGVGFVWTNSATIMPISPQLGWLSEGFVPPVLSIVLIFAGFLVWLGLTVRGRSARVKHGLGVSRPPAFAVKVAIAVGAFAFLAWAAAGYNGIPMAVVVMGTVVLILTAVSQQTKFGRSLYAIGGNREAARLAGINTRRVVLVAFAVMGLMYSVAGILITARLNGSPPNTGLYLELDAISAAVIGGASLSGGGIGTVPGALMGALLLASIDNGMSLMNVSSFLQLVIKGLVLLFAVWLDVLSRRRMIAR
jgi:D-xylose transport system permease protein